MESSDDKEPGGAGRAKHPTRDNPPINLGIGAVGFTIGLIGTAICAFIGNVDLMLWFAAGGVIVGFFYPAVSLFRRERYHWPALLLMMASALGVVLVAVYVLWVRFEMMGGLTGAPAY